MQFSTLPELDMLGGGREAVRIPPDRSVPLSPRTRRIIDTPEMRRLSRVSQLGLVSLVYPGAVHSRFEHSLGVFRLALEFVARLRHDPRFEETVAEEDARAFVLAALVHDLGHWAYCHPVEDMALEGIPHHESLVAGILADGEAGRVMDREWGVAPARVAELVAGRGADPAGRLLCSLLSGPVDVDKMDYLVRDSLHAGVPYGRHFDQERLLSSLCVDAAGGLAIDEKGRSAAELLVMARTVMFSEVYWHHTVRAATAMLQRAVWILRPGIASDRLVRSDDREFVDWILAASAGSAAEPLAHGLFGTTRRIHKRLVSFDAAERPDVHRLYSGRPYGSMVAASHRLAALLEERTGVAFLPHSLLIDAPPVAREVEFLLSVKRRSAHPAGPETWHRLEDVSPLVRTLAREQFDNVVKRVRIFCPIEQAERLAAIPTIEAIVRDAAREAADVFGGDGQPRNDERGGQSAAPLS
jgi:HD superfamily phosphohydrolase